MKDGDDRTINTFPKLTQKEKENNYPSIDEN